MKTWLDDWLDTLLLATAIASLPVLLTMILWRHPGGGQAKSTAQGGVRGRLSGTNRPLSRPRVVKALGRTPLGIADLHHLDTLHATRRDQLHLVALARLQQRPRDRRDPAHLAVQVVGLVDALDGDGA